MIKIFTNIILILVAASLTSCLSGTDFDEMEKAEKEFSKKMRQENPIFMSYKDMFSDPDVRALAKAAGKGKVNQVDELVEQGVDVNSRGAGNVTPLYWAMRNRTGFKRLLELGADPNVYFDFNISIMHSAVRLRDKSILKIALAHGGDPDFIIPDNWDSTPIFEALWKDSESIHILLDAGANINATDEVGGTPLTMALKLGYYESVYVLLDRGADCSIKNIQGEDAVSIARDIKYRLAERGVSTKKIDKVLLMMGEN